MLYPSVNQSLGMIGAAVLEERRYDVEFDETIAYLQHYNLLRKNVDFDNNWMKLGEFLIDEKNKFKAGVIVLNKKQIAVLDQSLHDIVGRRVYS